jgi:hypothetical protein
MHGTILYLIALDFKTAMNFFKSFSITIFASFIKQALAVSTTSLDVNP